MGLIDFPNPVSIIEGAVTGKLERDAAHSLLSAAYSGMIAFLWSSRVAKWLGLQDVATAEYLALQPACEKGLMVLTVPKDLLDPDNLARFQTCLRGQAEEKK